jgi:hypothetical protein
VIIGEQVKVYFDRSNPAADSLEDFEAASRRERGILPFPIIGILGVMGFIVYSKVRST